MLNSEERIGRAVNLACLLADTYYSIKGKSKAISLEEKEKLRELAVGIQDEKIKSLDQFCEKWDEEDRVILEIVFNALMGYLSSKRTEH